MQAMLLSETGYRNSLQLIQLAIEHSLQLYTKHVSRRKPFNLLISSDTDQTRSLFGVEEVSISAMEVV